MFQRGVLTVKRCLHSAHAVRENLVRRYFEAGNYWSETENSATNARNVNFTDGNQNNNNKTNTNYVRCVKGYGNILRQSLAAARCP